MLRAARAGWGATALLVVCVTGCATLRSGETVPATPVVPGSEPSTEIAPALPPPPTPEPCVHVVTRGETLTGIARRYGVSVEHLVQENALADPDRLEVGQSLRLPGAPAPLAHGVPMLVSGLAWPVDGGHVLSAFGAPRGGRSHTGVDIGGRAGQPIHAARDGVVVFTGTLRGYGRTVILDHGDGLRSLYAHNQEVTVSEGDTVEKGAQIARLGRSGNATTDHCHFEIRQGEVPIDPLPLLSQASNASTEERP